jgi:lipoprotein-anchoring transpeptidase ErfK/SrfK
LVLFLVVSASAFAQDVYIAGPEQAELTQGQTYLAAWNAGGAETVDISLVGTRTPLGAKSRGPFEIAIARGIPAVENERAFAMPWVDSAEFALRIIGRDGSGNRVSAGEREYRFRPAVLANRTDDGLYLDLHEKTNQRLYVQKNGVIARAYICSSSMKYRWLPANVHLETPHDHAGVFHVISKSPKVHSRQYDVDMPWAMQYLSGHFIHATSPNLYRLLGRPASHGCNRLTREDARSLYAATPVGTRVEVIGPGG